MADTILRQLDMLRLLPHWPQKIDTQQLLRNLESSGYSTSQRTVQRDLQKLSTIFPITCDESIGQFGWSWSKDAAPLAVNSMPPHVAIAFTIAEQYLGKLLPTKTFEHLSGYFKIAHNTIKKSNNEHFNEWQHKIGIASSRHGFVEPEVDRSVIETVYAALFEDKCIQISYFTASSSKVKQAIVHPQGVLLREPAMYLLCTFDGYSEVRQLAFHRITRASLSDQVVSALEGFTVEQYVSDNLHDLNVANKINLKLRLSERQAIYVKESPISIDQSMVKSSDGMYSLEATLIDTIQLRRWLLSITGDVEVIEPQHLRDYLIGKLRDQAAMYNLTN
jgi:predicted DNA-binding transcriptional regulator YafY